MPNSAIAIKRALLAALIWSGCVLAGGAKPTQEFWDYMMEYSDEQGDVLDPLEYDQVHSLKEQGTPVDAATEKQIPLENANSQTKIMPTKFTSSSSQSSRVSVKGAAL